MVEASKPQLPGDIAVHAGIVTHFQSWGMGIGERLSNWARCQVERLE